jgi:hypothetical protein
MGSEPPSEEVDPIARKLTEAAARKQEAADAASGEHLLEADFTKFARENGPTEFKKIEQLAASRVSAISAQGPTQFNYEQASHSIESGIFSASFSPVTNGHFEIRLSVGLALNAAQRMDRVPLVVPQTWHYIASADQDGFFWWNEASGATCEPDEIVNNALEALSDLILAPMQFEDDGSF